MTSILIDNLKRLLLENKNKEVIKYYKKHNKFFNKSESVLSKNIAGISLINLKNFKEAEKVLKQALDDDSDNVELLVNLAVCFLSQNEIDQSLELLNKAINLDPEFIDPKVFKVKAIAKKGYEDLISFYQTLKDNFNKHDSRVLSELAHHLFVYNDFFKSEKIYKYLYNLREFQKNIFIINRLALCLEYRLMNTEAETLYKKCLEIEPRFIDANLNYATFLRSLGRVKESLERLNYILQLKPTDKKKINVGYLPETYRHISISHKYKEKSDPILQEMLKLLKSEGFNVLSSKDKSQLLFAISKAFDDLNDKENFADFVIRANDQRYLSLSYNEKNTLEHFQMMKQIVTPTFIENNSVTSSETTPTPIFIVGMPRSGTTLCEQIICSNDTVFSAGELFFFQNSLKKHFKSHDPKKFANEIIQNFKSKANIIQNEYLDSLQQFPLNGKKYVVDKHPFNFFFIGFIRCIFPESKIVFCKRNPADTCLSIYKNFFPMDGIGFAYNQKQLANYYNAHNDLMKYYLSIFKDKIYTLEYEKLVEKKEEETKKLINFLNFDWNDDYLNFNKKKQVVKTLSVNQVRSNIYNTSLNLANQYNKYFPELFGNLR